MECSLSRMPDFTDDLLKELENESTPGFSVLNENGKAMLVIDKPLAGKKTSLEEVRSRLFLLSLKNVDWIAVDRAVRDASGEKYFIGDYPGSEALDARAEVFLAEDSMSASLYLHPPQGGRPLSKADLVHGLRESGITMGYLEDVIDSIAHKPEYLRHIVVARGRTPVHGENGFVQILFNTSHKPTPKKNEAGQVDHREIGLITHVAAGEPLARIVPPGTGFDGFTVDGKTIPAMAGTPAAFTQGPNTHVEGEFLVASIEGRPIAEHYGEIRVEEVILLDQVDYSTGNIDFPGSVIVENRVADGFSLATKGSIILKKSVGNISLKADGDIILAGGFMGRGEGSIESGGNIYARFIEQGRAKARNNIIIAEAAMHSQLIAGKSIEITGGRGELIGGETIAGESITCKKIGAKVETPTRLTVGTPPEVLESLHAIREEISALQETRKKIEMAIAHLKDKQIKKTAEEKDFENLIKLNEAAERYSSKIENLQDQFDTARASFPPLSGSFVYVLEQLYPKVEINLGKNRLYRSPLRGTNLRTAIYLGQDGDIAEASAPPLKSRSTEKGRGE